MAETISQHQTSAFTVPVNGQPNDAADVLSNDNALRTANNAHDADAGIHVQSSVVGSRPGAGSVGRKWYTTDTKKLYYDNGSSWDEIDYAPTDNATFSTSVSIGATPAASGPLRLTNNQWITQRNAANTADHSVIGIGSDDKMTIGDTTHTTEINLSCKSTASVDYQPGGTATIRLAPEGLNFPVNTTGGAAHIYRNATSGIVIRGVTGSSYDFAIGNNAGGVYLRGVTGGTIVEVPTALRVIRTSAFPSGHGSPLLVVGNAGSGVIGEGANNFGYNLAYFGTSATPQYATYKHRGTEAAPTAVQSNDVLADFVGYGGYSTTISDVAAGANITMNATQTWTGSVRGADIRFFVTPNGSTTKAQYMRLTNSGALEIGGSSQMALTGTIRGKDGFSIKARDAGDTADNAVIDIGGTTLTVGGTPGIDTVIGSSFGGDQLSLVTNLLRFFDISTGAARQVVTGSRSSGAAFANLLSALELYNLIVDSTTA